MISGFYFQADFQNSQVLLNTLLNEKNDSTLVTENKYHHVMITHGSEVDDTESEIFEQCLIEDMKPKKLRTIQIPYDNNNFLKSQINEPKGMHRQEMISDVHWEVDRYNRNYIKRNVHEPLGLHRLVPQTERKWPIEQTNMNFIKSRFNQPEGLHRLVPEREDQWIVNQDNKNYVRSHVNSHKGMHRIGEEYKDQWTVEQDNRNFAKSYVNFHQGMHRNLPEPEQQWDVTHGNQNFIKSRVNCHIGMHRIMPDPPMQWKVDQNNMNYVKSYVNNHTGTHRNVPDMDFKWEVGHNNQAYVRSYVNDHQGMHRYTSVPDGKWGVTNNNNKNFARSHINYPLGMHRIATMPKDEQWQVTHDNKNYIKSCINQNIAMHISAPDPKQQWTVSYDNKNFVKSVVNDPKGMHEKVIPSDEQWHVGYDNKNYIRSGINKHTGMHRDLPEQEPLWKVAYGNKNFVKSHVNDHKGMYKKVPRLHGKWKVKGDNKNYIKSLINQHGGHHWKIPDVEPQWMVDFDNKNYIRSYVNEHHGMHKISSELSIFLKSNKMGSKYAKSDTDIQQLYENCPETGDFLEVKYGKVVKIFKSDEDYDAEQDIQWSSKDSKGYTGKKWEVLDSNQNYASTLVDRNPKISPSWRPTKEIRVEPHEMNHTSEYTSGFAFEQDDVPFVPEPGVVSQGGFRFHDVMRNYYDYDNDWVDQHNADYIADSLHYRKSITPPDIQLRSGRSFPQEDVPHAPELRRVDKGGFRFAGTTRNSFDFEGDQRTNDEWMMYTSQHPEYKFRSKSREYRKPGTTRAKFDIDEDVDYDEMNDFLQSENERICGTAFPQDDVPHQPELRRTSRGGFRYHGVVRNVYDYDPEDEEEWMKFAAEHPEYQLRTKSRDYRKPGTTRAHYDTQDYMQVERNTGKPRHLPVQTRNKQPRKWSKVAEQTVGTSRYEDNEEYYNAVQEQDVSPQVADRLKYFHETVSVPGSSAVPISHQYPIVSRTVQDNLRAYQKDTTPKSKPTIRGRSLRRSSSNTTDQQAAFSRNVEGHHNHENDYGSTHHSQYEEVMNKGGRKMYVSSEETYSELHHKGR